MNDESEKDSFDSTYLLSRQVANEYHGPAFQAWRDHYANMKAASETTSQTEPEEELQTDLQGTPAPWKPSEYVKHQQAQFVKQMREQGKSEEEIQSELEGMQEPYIDPVTAFAGGAVSGAKTAAQAGLKLIPSLGRAVTSGVVSAGMEYPIGMASAPIEQKFPALALPFTLAAGLLSGAAIEPAIERGIARAAQKASYKLTEKGTKELVDRFYHILANESGEIDVWHGSPHKFEKFSTKEIGTGQGAQSFGWGLYFTDKKAIAEHYAKVNVARTQQAKDIVGKGFNIKGDFYQRKHIKKPIQEKFLKYNPSGMSLQRTYFKNGEEIPEEIFEKAYFKYLNEEMPTLYKTKLFKGKDPSEYTFLDWDKPVGEKNAAKIKAKILEEKPSGSQFPLVRDNELLWAPGESISGESAYKELSRALGSDKEASLFLQRAGIDGIRYPAGSLSGVKSEAKNYVVFDESAITPISRESGGVVEDLTIKDIPQEVFEEINNEIGNTPLSKALELLKNQRGEIQIDLSALEDKTTKQLSGFPGVKVGTGIPQTKTTIGAQMRSFLEADPEFTKKIAKSGTVRDFAANINLSRIENAEQLAEIYGKTVAVFGEEIREARRGYRSNAQTVEAAEMLGMTPKQLLARRKGVAFNAEEVTAGRFMLSASADNLKTLAKNISTAQATDLDKFEFRRALNLHYGIQAQVSGMTAEAGRALQAFNIMAKSEQVKLRQINDLLRSSLGGVEIEDIAKAINSIDSLEGLNTFTRQMQRATTKDMMLEAWINGLLSGPQTHAVNTLSNALTAFLQVPERFLASGFSKALPGVQDIRARESVEQLYGLVQGFKDGLKAAGKTAWTGLPTDPESKIEAMQYRAITAENVRQHPLIRKIAPNALKEGGVSAHAVNVLGEIVRLPGRGLMAEDEFFKAIGYRMELNALAYRKAVVGEGLTDKQEIAQRIQEIISDPQTQAPEIHLAAIDSSRYQTFTNPLDSKILRALGSSNNPVTRVIMPFVRTPTNIVRFAFERTPLAPVMKSVREDIAAGGARRDLALARMSLGSMAMATIGTLSASGMITGGGPSDKGLRQYKYNQGWQPYSFKVGDKYYSYGRLEPLGMLFGMAADFVEIAGQMSEVEREKYASMIVGAISKNIMSKTWLRGLSEVVTALDDPDRYGAQWWNRFAGTIVPTGLAQVERVVSPEMEYVSSALDQIKSRIPGYSKDLPLRRNLWGEPVLMEGGVGPDIVSPIYTSKAKESPIDKELYDLRMPLRMPRNTQQFQGIPVKLTPHEYERFVVLMNEQKLSTGANLKDSLNYLVTKDPDYKAATDDQKEMMIRRHMREAGDLARQALYDENGELQQIVEQAQKVLEAAQ